MCGDYQFFPELVCHALVGEVSRSLCPSICVHVFAASHSQRVLDEGDTGHYGLFQLPPTALLHRAHLDGSTPLLVRFAGVTACACTRHEQKEVHAANNVHQLLAS